MSIEVTPYDPDWPTVYVRIARDLRAALADVEVIAIEHVGSTAVPGLASKPVVDIDIVVAAGAVAAGIETLQRIGYRYQGMRGVLDRHAFRAPEDGGPRRHVYLLVAGSLALRNHLALRDTLRRDARLRDRYARVKRQLADEASGAEEYGAAKTGIVDEILAGGGLTTEERSSIRWTSLAPTARRASDDAVVTDDGATLWVEESGNPPSAPVVLCHGGPGIGDYLEELRDLLLGMEMRVVRWDQRGAGRSDVRGPFSLDRFVADLEAVRRTVVGERCWMLGHSWGANLAMAYAQQYSQNLRGMIYMCGTGLEWWPDYARRYKQRQAERLGAELGSRLEELRWRARTRAEEQECRDLDLRSELDDPGNVDLSRRLLRAEQRFPVNREVNTSINAELKGLDLQLQQSRCLAVTVPVLVIHGESDPRPAMAVDSLEAALPNVDRVRIDRAGHWPWLEERDQVERLLGDFMWGAADGG